METDNLLTAQEAAQRLRMHPITLRRLAQNGAINFYRIGRRIKFSAEHLREFLDQREARPPRFIFD